MTDPLYLDCETRCTIPLARGLALYATQVEVTVIAWAVGDGPVHVWDALRQPCPEALMTAAFDCERVIAHNAQFDRTVIESDPNLRELSGLLEGKWYCTMAAAYRVGLPGALDKLCAVFKVPTDDAKHKNGRDLIMLFCKPNKDGKWNDWRTHPVEWKQFLEYAGSDITSMRYVHKRMPKWNDTPRELRVWDVDQAVNQRGVAADLDLARHAVRATTKERKRLGDRTTELTQGDVLQTTQRDRLLTHLFIDHGITLPDLRADTVERRLEDPELDETVRELLRLRLAASKSSTTKYKRVLEIQVAGRLLNLLQYGSAYRTLRWGGRNFQPQNLPRPRHDWPDIEAAIAAIKSESEDLLLGDDVMQFASDAIRSVLVAAPGHKLLVSDLSNIEGRDLPWLAGEEWKLQAFRDYDAGIGPDLYCVIYGQTFNVDPAKVTKEQRQIGKVLELAFAIGGGPGAVVTAAAAYGFDLEELAAKAVVNMPKRIHAEATEHWHWAVRKRQTKGLPQHIFVAAEGMKRMWREAHPATTSFWTQLEAAARTAIWNPGTTVKAGAHVEFDMKGVWLRMRLPSGRYLCYPNAAAEGERGEVSFMAWDVYRKGWARQTTWGGKLASDARQSVAREILADGLVAAEDRGLRPVLSVHDELVCEAPDGPEYTSAMLDDCLTYDRPWAKGLPLAAAGHEMYRYRKL